MSGAPLGAPVAPLVLIADGDGVSRDVREAQLRTAGLRVSIARTGFEAIVKACCYTPDVILLDISLPVMDGWEVARTLESSEATRRIPIIALTAHAMAGDRDRALEAGCDDYHTKPVQFPRLLAQIEALLQKGHAP